MDLKSKILRAINRGLNEALDLDDFSEDDLKILKKSLKQSILNSNFNNAKLYYQDLIKLILDKTSYYISKEDILNCIDWCKLYNMKYNPHLDGEEFNYLINYKIIAKYGDDVNLNWIDTSEVTDMDSLFLYSLFNGDISEWDVSNVTDMDSLFLYSLFNGDISEWDVSNVKSMHLMFSESKFNSNISNWDVSSVTNMRAMFDKSLFNQDISKWDISNVTDMSFMFSHSKFNKDISNWDISNVISMTGMFNNSEFNQDISNWHINKSIYYIDNMFDNCPIKEEYKPKK